jgi:hypothetical protein
MGVWGLELTELLRVAADFVDDGMFLLICEIPPTALEDIAIGEELDLKC